MLSYSLCQSSCCHLKYRDRVHVHVHVYCVCVRERERGEDNDLSGCLPSLSQQPAEMPKPCLWDCDQQAPSISKA